VAVRAKAQVNQVKDSRRTGNLAQSYGVPYRCSFEIGGLNWHSENLLGAQRGAQAFVQVCKVSVGVSGRGHALIHLRQVNIWPGKVFIAKGTHHRPGSMAAADGHDETTTGGDGSPSFGGNERSGLAGNCICIGKHFDFHALSVRRTTQLARHPALPEAQPSGYASLQKE
jgi:hypothetical protein